MPKSKEFISDSDSGSDSEEVKPKKKKAKKEPEKKKPEAKAGGSGGETMFQLAKMKYATVSEFKGKKMVQIREYYEKDGEMLPGRKGIALMPDQWKKLKEYVEEIDEALENL